MAYTAGFNSDNELQLHFAKHKDALGVPNADEYLRRADAFLGEPRPTTVSECRRSSDNDLLRFDESNQEFGVLRADGIIRTFYRLTGPPRDQRWFLRKCKG